GRNGKGKYAVAQEVEGKKGCGARQLVPQEQPPQGAAATDLEEGERRCRGVRQRLQSAQGQTEGAGIEGRAGVIDRAAAALALRQRADGDQERDHAEGNVDTEEP